MAGSTRKLRISLAPAFTRNQSIGCRSRGRDTFDSSEFHIPPGTVTRAAEVDRIRGIETSGVEDGRLRISRRGCGLARHALDMASPRSVAGFTSHAGNQVLLVEAPSDAGTCCMATETSHHFSLRNGTFHSFFNTGRREQSARWRKIDGSKCFEVRDPGFKEITVLFLEQVGLTHASGTECPEQWKRQALFPITHRVPARAPSGLDLILVLARFKDHQWMRTQNVGKGGEHRSPCHGGFLLR